MRLMHMLHKILPKALQSLWTDTALVFLLAVCASLSVGCTGRKAAPVEPARRSAANAALAGFPADTWLALDRALELHVEQRREVPGAVLAIGRNGAVVYERAVGWRDEIADAAEPMERATLFDVASLTKPVATAAAAALLICRGELTPETDVAGEPLDRVLRHGTGLPAYVDWHEVVRAGQGLALDEALAKAIAQPARSAGGEHARARASTSPPGYSNVAYLFASLAIEQQAGRPMGELLGEEFWRPIGMEHTTFHPPRESWANVARTDKKLEPGRPYDPLADFLVEQHPGHDPGHSGLFSTATDLTVFCQALLHPELSSLPEMPCIAEYLLGEEERTPREQMGFAAAPGRTPAFERDRKARGRAVYFHTGYTGCLMWLDVESGTSVVLLTNSTWKDARAWESLSSAILVEMARALKE
ncbi:MAG: hypothetical protein PWP23_3175 [Candidatus Sumerlaeota bacterium]|nr:hypothetical protein [Candidatus Sumerlaeota bacterium]